MHWLKTRTRAKNVSVELLLVLVNLNIIIQKSLRQSIVFFLSANEFLERLT